LEGLVTRHRQRWEKLQANLDAREAEKKNLQCKLEEALAKAEADAVAWRKGRPRLPAGPR